MKTPLLIAAVVAAFTIINAASAAEPVLSPRAKEIAASFRKVSGTTPDRIDRSALPGTPRGRELAFSVRKVPRVGPNVDLAHGPVPPFPPKDPRYEAALRELRNRTFEIAPLK